MKRRPRDIEWLIDYYLDELKPYGIQEGNIRNFHKDWQQKHPRQSIHDFMWMIYNTIISEIPKQVSDEVDQYRYKKDVYLKMYHYLLKEEKRNGKHIFKLAIENGLKYEYY